MHLVYKTNELKIVIVSSLNYNQIKQKLSNSFVVSKSFEAFVGNNEVESIFKIR